MATPGNEQAPQPTAHEGPGRPTIYSDELVRDLCLALMEGESLTGVCSKPWAPHRSTVYEWAHSKKEFSDALARARKIGQEARVDLLYDVGRGLAGTGDVARDRLLCENIRWEATRTHSTMFGDKQTTEVTGKDGGPIETVSTQDSLRWILLKLAEYKDEKK